MRMAATIRVALVLLCLAAMFGREATMQAPDAVTLDVPGRTDSTPWLAASGSFVAVAWGATAEGKTDVFVAVSRDAGSTFGRPVQVNRIAGEARLGGEMPPRVALSTRSGAATPDVTVLWTARGARTEIRTARSTDGGRTFDAPVTLQSPDAPGDRGWPAVALDGRGRTHAIWLDHRGMTAGSAAGDSHAGHQAGAAHDGAVMAQRSALYYASVAGTGERELATGVCYCCKTALAAGPDGSLFAAWRHVYSGNHRDMALAVSRNGGRSFSPPVRVSEDGWVINGCPDDGPAMAVDAGGTVHLVWPTVVGGAKPQGAIFYASTRDGVRFTPRVRVPTLGSPKPSHPQVAVDRSGRIFIAWDETVAGRRVAAVRTLRLQQGRSPAFGDIVTLTRDSPAMYPVLAATDRGMAAVWTTGGERPTIGVRRLD